MTAATSTIPALLDEHLARRPRDVALIEGARRISYAELDALGREAAGWLSAQGIGSGDRVAVWLPNRVEWLALFFGLSRVGAALVAVNTRYRATELEHILDRTRARLLVLQPDFRKIDFGAVLQEVRPAALRHLERIAVVGATGGTPASVLGKATVPFPGPAASVRPAPAEGGTGSGCAAAGQGDPEALAALFTTSGTTSAPKLVMHAQRTIAFHSRRVARAHGFTEPGARLLAALPLCGVFGLNSALAALTGGAAVVMMDTFDGAAAVALIRAHAVTHLYATDEMYRRMLEVAPPSDPFPGMRVLGYAAFNVGAVELARSMAARGLPIVGLYGSSEAQALFAKQPGALPLEQRIEPGGMPASAADGAELRVRDAETGRLLPPGQSGDLEIRAPSNFVGYLDDPGATSSTVLPDGFFRTGDVARLREDGSFVFETRRGDAIRIGGFLVSPFEIEEALKRVPGVAQAGVVGVDIGGALRCVAFVIPAPGTTLREAEVLAAAKSMMAGFKVPARVWCVDAFPTTEGANGVKIQRARLRDMALERLGSEPRARQGDQR